jgi:hypothetical protein
MQKMIWTLMSLWVPKVRHLTMHLPVHYLHSCACFTAQNNLPTVLLDVIKVEHLCGLTGENERLANFGILCQKLTNRNLASSLTNMRLPRLSCPLIHSQWRRFTGVCIGPLSNFRMSFTMLT